MNDNDPTFYRVSVKGIVIDDDGRVLLARESDARWSILGGGLKHGEDPIEGLKREIQEETGLDVTYVSDSPKYFITANNADKNFYGACVVYQIELSSLDFTPTDECLELKFFSPEEMAQLNLWPSARELCNQLLKNTT